MKRPYLAWPRELNGAAPAFSDLVENLPGMRRRSRPDCRLYSIARLARRWMNGLTRTFVLKRSI